MVPSVGLVVQPETAVRMGYFGGGSKVGHQARPGAARLEPTRFQQQGPSSKGVVWGPEVVDPGPRASGARTTIRA